MEPEMKTIQDFREILRRRKKALIIPALIIFVTAAGVAFLLPPIYRSTATILIEEQEIPKEYAISMVTSFAEQRIQTYTQRIMSSPRLLDIITRFNLYADMRSKWTIEEVIEKMRKDIKLEAVTPEVNDRRTGRPTTVAFTIAYEGKKPDIVQQVANTLAPLYLQENLKVREEKTAGASKFIEDEMNQVQASLASQDAKIAEYKQKHINTLPELSQMNLQELERVERNVEQFDIQLRFLKEREGSLQTQLASTPRYLVSQEKDRPDKDRPDKDRLKELEFKMLNLNALYTDRHPDVIKTKREIADLEKKIQMSGGEAVAIKPEDPAYKPENPAYKLDSPAYITLSSQLSGTQAEIESVKKQIAAAGRKREEYVRRIQSSPRVEEGYRGLIAERNNLQVKYDDLMKKYMETKVASGMEKEQMGECFTLVDPPRLPVKPVKPNVPAILLIGLILGIGGGVGAVSLREYSDQSVRSVAAITRATGFAVLASVPDILTPRDIATLRKRRMTLMISTFSVILIAVAVFHFFIMDLEVFWAVLQRRIALL